MPDSEVKQKVQNQDHPRESLKLNDVFDDLRSLKDRPESRRGPFIISDEDLNNQFDL
jgi:hypothetical protein